MTKKTRGDVFRINIVPPANTFPWVRIFRHPYGIRKAGISVAEPGVNRKDSRRKTALMIGEKIIRHSEVLSSWFTKSEQADKKK